MKIVVAITGASGAIYGWRLLERLQANREVEIHLVLSRSGEKTLFLETGKSISDIKKLAHFSYPNEDIGCRLASGSFRTDAMVIAPCSIHTMSAIAGGISSNLLIRAADVTLKERRKLILMVRESPFHLGHLRNHDCAGGNGSHYCPSYSRFLSPTADGDGHRGSQRGPGAGPDRGAGRSGAPLGRRRRVKHHEADRISGRARRLQ